MRASPHKPTTWRPTPCGFRTGSDVRFWAEGFFSRAAGEEVSSRLRKNAVGDGKRLIALLDAHRRDPQHAAELVVRHLHRAGRFRGARRALRKRRRAGGMERHGAFDL